MTRYWWCTSSGASTPHVNASTPHTGEAQPRSRSNRIRQTVSPGLATGGLRGRALKLQMGSPLLEIRRGRRGCKTRPRWRASSSVTRRTSWSGEGVPEAQLHQPSGAHMVQRQPYRHTYEPPRRTHGPSLQQEARSRPHG
ncbi:hypothetical protein D1007_62119 [Hordeum vulgare]|nr:hypothetical protein D1007_62119 [Hordeum vulgare]